jgi:hypothetical protein
MLLFSEENSPVEKEVLGVVEGYWRWVVWHVKVAKQGTEVALEVRHNYGPQTAATVARFLLPHELGAGDLFLDLTRNQTSYYGDQS